MSRKSTYLIGNKLGYMQNRVLNSLNKSQLSMQKIVAEKDNKLGILINKLDALSPLRILKSGYFKAEKDGVSVQNISKLSVGDDLTLYAKDGKIKATVNEIIINEEV